MGRANATAKQTSPFWGGRRQDHVYVDALFEQAVPKCNRLLSPLEQRSDNRTHCGSELEPQFFEAIIQASGIVPQSRAQLRSSPENPQGGSRGANNRRAEGGRENIGTADVPGQLRLIMIRDAEAAGRSQTLAEGSDDEVDTAIHVSRFGQPTPLFTQYP